MENEERNRVIWGGVFAFVAIGLIILLIFPYSEERTIILQTPSGTESCVEDFVLAQNMTDLCDVTIISPSNGQIVRYNGSQWVNVASSTIGESTVCNNVGSGTIVICAGGNVNLKTLLAGAGITLAQNSTNVMISANVTEDDTVCANVGAGSQVYKDGECNFRTLTEGSNIDLTQNANDISIAVTGITSESTVCSNTGTGNGLCNGGNIQIKSLIAGSGITISDTTDDYTIINASPEATACNNVGTGNQLCSGGNVNLDTLIAGDGITISDTTDDWTFASTCENTGTGEAICEANNNINSLISGDTNTLTITDTTGDLTLTPTLRKLCEAVASGGETSLTCTLSSSQQFLFVTAHASFDTDTSTLLRLRFNGDSGTNYSYRTELNGGADSTSTSTSGYVINGNIASQKYFISFRCFDYVSSLEKLCQGDRTFGATGAANVPAKSFVSLKWANIANDITSVSIERSAGTGVLEANNFVSVWGYS